MIKRLLFPVITFLTTFLPSLAGEQELQQFNFNNSLRTYKVYVPTQLKKDAPLCIYLHGYGSDARWRPDLNDAAEKYGYIVCYPDGAADTKGKYGWNVGYPTQSNMADNEADFLKALIADVYTRYGTSRENVFCTGVSNGGDLIYKLLYTEPDIFKAYASVAGLTFSNVFLNNKLSTPVPLLEIHGTGDKTSMWNGDPGNTGGWGPYVSVPVAVGAVAANNRCQSYKSSYADAKPTSDAVVIHHRYFDSPSGCDVELYEITDGPHSWCDKDINTGGIIIDFFNRYLSK